MAYEKLTAVLRSRVVQEEGNIQNFRREIEALSQRQVTILGQIAALQTDVAEWRAAVEKLES